MSLTEDLAGSLDGWLRQFGYLDELALGVLAWSDMERQVGTLIAALAARGIDLELAYQWRRAEKALPEGWWFECYISGVLAGDINPHTGYPVTSPTHRYVAVSQPTWYPLCDDSDEAPIEVRGEADSPAAALSALVDALEART